MNVGETTIQSGTRHIDYRLDDGTNSNSRQIGSSSYDLWCLIFLVIGLHQLNESTVLCPGVILLWSHY